MLRIAIIDDEKEMTLDLKNNLSIFLTEEKTTFQIATFDSGILFLENFKSDFDLILLDISMPVLDGITTAKEIRKIDSQVMIVFVTSLAQYAINGYEVNAFDYILKPIDYYNFKLKMNRALLFLKNKNDRSFVVNYKNIIKRIEISKLMYIEIYDHHICFHLVDGENIHAYGTMKTYIELLKNESFMLCNQCYLVNLKYVQEVTADYVKVDNTELALARPRRKEFISALNNYLTNGGK